LFKVIHVGTSENLVSSVCYDEQHACVYLQPFVRARGASSGGSKIAISWGCPIRRPRSREIFFSSGTQFSQNTRSYTLSYTVQTDGGQTDRQNHDSWYALSVKFCRA